MRLEGGVRVVGDLVRDSAGDEVEGNVAELAVARDVCDTPLIDEGAPGPVGLGEGEVGKGLVATTEDGVVGESGEDRVIVLILD